MPFQITKNYEKIPLKEIQVQPGEQLALGIETGTFTRTGGSGPEGGQKGGMSGGMGGGPGGGRGPGGGGPGGGGPGGMGGGMQNGGQGAGAGGQSAVQPFKFWFVAQL